VLFVVVAFPPQDLPLTYLFTATAASSTDYVLSPVFRERPRLSNVAFPPRFMPERNSRRTITNSTSVVQYTVTARVVDSLGAGTVSNGTVITVSNDLPSGLSPAVVFVMNATKTPLLDAVDSRSVDMWSQVEVRLRHLYHTSHQPYFVSPLVLM
jgi:hypothetical protein